MHQACRDEPTQPSCQGITIQWGRQAAQNTHCRDVAQGGWCAQSFGARGTEQGGQAGSLEGEIVAVSKDEKAEAGGGKGILGRGNSMNHTMEGGAGVGCGWVGKVGSGESMLEGQVGAGAGALAAPWGGTRCPGRVLTE